jgi:D-serine deaminase-like pyridoxal phosphate-dependent protein
VTEREIIVVGMEKNVLETPVLWVDLDTMEGNIAHLAGFFRRAGVGWRPHIKGIKVPAIAHQLLQAGAIGITCAKLGEAEVMAAAGMRDILIAHQVVGPRKAKRLASLQRHADVMVAVDSMENASEIEEAALRTGVDVPVLIEVNIGLNRCGVEVGEPAVDLANEIATLSRIQLRGVMGYEGHAIPIPDLEEKERVCKKAVGSLVATAEMLQGAGFDTPIVSCGGSGTYRISSNIPGVTEIQAGGAVFSDMAYKGWGVDTEPSLFVLTTVVSRPTPTRAILDAGRKAMNGEVAMPHPMELEGARLTALHAEHGLLELESSEVPLRVGDKIDFIVGYGDNTVYLHDRLYGVRNGEVEVIWTIQARGKLT